MKKAIPILAKAARLQNMKAQQDPEKALVGEPGEEPRLAKAMAEKAMNTNTFLNNYTTAGCFTLSSDGSIFDLNTIGAGFLGKDRISLVNSNLKSFLTGIHLK